jgi:dienelactone hydrolase
MVRAVRLFTTDDVEIHAAYYPTTADRAPAVMLLHGFDGSRDDWNSVAPLLQRNGLAALAVDLRGHGQSLRRLTADGPQFVNRRKFQTKDYQDMLLDLNAAYEWLGDQPGIDPERIAIVGAGLGANLAVRYAAFNEEIAALVLLSPTLNYQGVRTDTLIVKIGCRPLRIATARQDSISMAAARKLVALRQEHGLSTDTNELVAATGQLSGTALLTGVKDLPAILFNWLNDVLTGP